MTVPPVPLVPHRSVIPKNIIVWTCPPFAACKASVLLELYTLDVSRARLGLKLELLSLVWLAFPMTLGHNQMLFLRVRFM